MRFVMITRDVGGGPERREDQNRGEVRSLAGAKRWARACVEQFNVALRPYEKAREFVRVERAESEEER